MSEFVFSLPERQKAIGLVLPPHEHSVTQDSSWAYARATNDENPRYQRGELTPPIYSVIPELIAMFAALKDERVIGDPKRFLRLLHGEHDMTFQKAMRPNHTYLTTVTVEDVQDKGSGELLTLRIDTKQASDGALCVSTKAGLFIRHPASHQANKPADSKPKAAPSLSGAAAPSEPLFVASEPTTSDQSLRYADASHDHNPIHKDPAVAEKAGLPGIILHGLCTMAFMQKHFVNHVLAGDAGRLRGLKVRFTKPVLPGQTVTITGRKTEVANRFSLSASVGEVVVASDGVAITE